MRNSLRKSRFIILFILFFNLCIVGILVSEGVWVSKINDEKLLLNDFMDYYTGFLYFQVMTSPTPVSDSDVNRLKANNEQFRLFLHSFEDEYLIIKKAKEKGLYDQKDIDKKVKLISEVVNNKLIVKSFFDKYIYPKLRVSSEEANKAYAEEMKKSNSPYKGIGKSKALKVISERLKVQKGVAKLKSYSSKLRLESQIIHNPSVVK